MKTIVVYKSLSGFTKEYAVWIAEELKADIFDRKNTTITTLAKYDLIIFGGSLHAVGVSGVDLIKNNLDKLDGKKIIIFTTGASPSREDIPEEIVKKNFTEDERKKIRLFYFRGGFDFNKLDLMNKILMTLLKWKIQMKRDRTPDEKGMLAAYSLPMDFTKKEYINPLLDYARSLG